MAEPGLRPIIPRFPPQPGPSPLIPVIVLVIVGTLRWWVLKVIDMWNSYDSEPYDWEGTFESIQSHFFISALLIPVCLLLAVQAFGIPQVNPVRNAPPPSPFFELITQNLWGSVLILVVIIVLLISIPIRSVIHSPWQPDSLEPRSVQTHRHNDVCEEIAILKRRCENWEGWSRNNVCRELAALQKRCEKSMI